MSAVRWPTPWCRDAAHIGCCVQHVATSAVADVLMAEVDAELLLFMTCGIKSPFLSAWCDQRGQLRDAMRDAYVERINGGLAAWLLRVDGSEKLNDLVRRRASGLGVLGLLEQAVLDEAEKRAHT